MTKLLQQFTKLFTTQSTLEQFLAGKNIKNHCDLEYWTKYAEYRGF